MKKNPVFILIIILIISSFIPVVAQNGNFTGEWKLNKEKTVLPDNSLFLSKITIQLKTDSLLTVRVYENSNGEEYPFEENLSFDGKDCKIVIYDMPRSSKATKSADGSINIESKTTFQGSNGEDNLIAKEVWKVDNDTKMLVLNYTNKSSGGEVPGTSYFNKIK
jgi:hypothetical protein